METPDFDCLSYLVATENIRYRASTKSMSITFTTREAKDVMVEAAYHALYKDSQDNWWVDVTPERALLIIGDEDDHEDYAVETSEDLERALDYEEYELSGSGIRTTYAVHGLLSAIVTVEIVQ